MSDHTAVNRAFWDEIAPHHAASEYYGIERFVSTRDSLGSIEGAELGSVADLTVCHLQCHIGLDTISLARRGAIVTGVDFSAASLQVARDLAERTDARASFVEADVLEAADVLGVAFDLVFTTRGVLMWVSDLSRWADTCARLLRPGGTLYLLDLHPLAMVLHSDESGLRLSGSYFGSDRPTSTSADASYAVRDVGLVHQETREWIHPIGAVVTALATAGLVIEFLHEHSDELPVDGSDAERRAAGRRLPSWYSIRAHRPESSSG